LIRRVLSLLIVLFALMAAPVVAQSIVERLITPGALSSDHAKLEAKCDSCHSSFDKSGQQTRCTSCHKGVGADIAQRTRYHGKYAKARSQACKTCHSEHKGRGYQLITFSRTGFDHALTNYPLTGAHSRAGCSACHGSGNNYRGISTRCATCHKRDEPHLGRLGTACQTCHTTSDWKSIAPFDHTRTGFRLSGAHARASCMSCHTGQVWQGLSQGCVACHAKDDAHRGSRGANCASCHMTSAWSAVTFDHDSTGFPLVGGHADAACAGCHGAGNANKHPSRTCVACHAKDDTHKGANGSDCASCHTPRAWKIIAFDHTRSTDFPLRGAHQGVECSACHTLPPKQASPPVTCFGCHAADDDHKGGNGQDCGRCHNETAWDKVDFDHNTMTQFPLLGKHAQARCEACHVQPADVEKPSVTCGACHTADDVHGGKLDQNCGRCHNSDSWKDGIRFDHALTHFPLLGKHAGLQCASCHADKTFAAKGVTCSACHIDDHHKGALGTPAACGDCHNTVDWKAWRFDHDLRTDFALTGKHKGLVCSACHNRPGDPGDVAIQCGACHRRDDIHRGEFGDDCARCHTTEDFARITMPGR
jgi:hypothetical protein